MPRNGDRLNCILSYLLGVISARKLDLGEEQREIARARSLAAKSKCAGSPKIRLLPDRQKS
jgi:hypothetical protein